MFRIYLYHSGSDCLAGSDHPAPMSKSGYRRYADDHCIQPAGFEI